ncbi:hypothetical protein PPYR_02155 [Photinus pyralis]|uniref:Uncharacterized protein n=2 Tax=Photinus pyralis TaxID=7054 RepID=A0A5N4B6G3_PHOPY|nr:hypothetical protein PPYR_12243 [Photinus pyralis]KAB0805185.1 hypothetical protein PPYR_02155 [Photinus pyralis]
MDLNKSLQRINAIGNAVERTVIKVRDMEVGKIYEIEKIKAISTQYGRGIVCEIAGNASIFLPQRMVKEMEENVIDQLNNLRMGVVLNGFLKNDTPKVELITIGN